MMFSSQVSGFIIATLRIFKISKRYDYFFVYEDVYYGLISIDDSECYDRPKSSNIKKKLIYKIT